MTNKEMIEPWRQYGVRLEKEDTVDGVTHPGQKERAEVKPYPKNRRR